MTGTVEAIKFYWRPGCGFCGFLDRQLTELGFTYELHNIWEDPQAAAYVRSVANGNETVPTVQIGDLGLVNPGPDTVVAAVTAHAPHLLPSAQGK